MQTQKNIDFERVADAILYINQNFKNQPTLHEIASSVHLSPFHFQKLFTDWAGTSPKKFLQYTSVEYAKSLLKKQQVTLFDATYETGLSSTSRLHDLFVNIEGMSPAEYKNGGQNLTINYSFTQTNFGNIIIASSTKGVCHIAFIDDEIAGLQALKLQFAKAIFVQKADAFQQNALHIFTNNWSNMQQIKLHLKGTDFQLKVWQALLKIPLGKLNTYGNIAIEIESPKASRAVGTAIGSNPIAFLIPCHRVIQSSGNIGGYMWGTTRKQVIIGWEAAQIEPA